MRKLMLEARWHSNYFIVPKVQVKFASVPVPSTVSFSNFSYHIHFKNTSQNLIFTTESHIYDYFKRFLWRTLKYIVKNMSENWRNIFFTSEMYVYACLCMYVYIHTCIYTCMHIHCILHIYTHIYIMAQTDTWFACRILRIHACSLVLCG